MLTTSISDFRRDIKKYLDKVTENFETLIINRGKDRGVVIMSLDEYNSLSATHHELSSESNEKRLDSTVEKLRKKESMVEEPMKMKAFTVSTTNQDALSILKGLEEAGLIVLPKKEIKHKGLSKRLRGTISGSRAKEMIETIDKERAEWNRRY